MTLEALLAYAHILAILTLVVFISSEAALCRAEWINAKVVERIVRVHGVYGFAALGVLLTGLARTWWGMKGAGWYWTNGLLYVKLALFVAVGVMAGQAAGRYRRWAAELKAGGSLPAEADVRHARKWIMIQAHVIALIPLAAVFLARGFGALR